MSTEYIDYGASTDLTERVVHRVWKRQVPTIEHGIGEIRMLQEVQSALAMTGLADSIKNKLRVDPFITENDVHALLDEHLDSLFGLDDTPHHQLELGHGTAA